MNLRFTAIATAYFVCTITAIAGAEDKGVRYGIETMTQRFVTAYKNRDIATIRRELTPDFAWKRPDGTSLNADKAMDGLRKQLDRVVKVDVMTIRLENLTTLGDSASNVAVCSFRGTVRDSSGAAKKVTSTSKYKYYWVKTKKGWRIDGITDLNNWSDTGKQNPKG